MSRVLPLRFFQRPAQLVARELVGALLVSTVDDRAVIGRIVETEAYLGRDDPASHAYRGRRYQGNAAIYGPAGSWYVYRSYGIHWCANLVTGQPEAGAAVLLRGVAIMTGLEVARSRRGPVADRRLADGPGKLCQAFGITRENLDGAGMRGAVVRVLEGEDPGPIEVTPRIGITKAVDWPLRFLTR
ncbi:MAG: DNA-3-methyladenine glycosylase [Gemmatimonadales bacterium]|nr:DNA-3-methyladenine glycosylase [Gemmatimonadales bacterium]